MLTRKRVRRPFPSLPVRGAWIEIAGRRRLRLWRWSLPVRGAWIEILSGLAILCTMTSLPVRGAWIEIGGKDSQCIYHLASRSPCGERGLKYQELSAYLHPLRRSPCGERGLKSVRHTSRRLCGERRSPCGERGLKWGWAEGLRPLCPSLPVRGAWIEIGCCFCRKAEPRVAPRAGSVD